MRLLAREQLPAPRSLTRWQRIHWTLLCIVPLNALHWRLGQAVPRAWLDRGWCPFTPWRGLA